MRFSNSSLFSIGTVGLLTVFGVSACSDDPKPGTGLPGYTAGGASGAAGAAGKGLSGSGAIGAAGAAGSLPIPTPPGTVNPGKAGSGAAGTPAPGAAGIGGVGGAGTGGGLAAGSGGGAAGIGGASGSGTAGSTGGPGGPYIREAAPTEASIRTKGEYTVKSFTERDGLVGGMAYGDAAVGGDGSELYYPEGATPPFAAMAIVPGFTAQRSDVAPWGSFLASHGIVALVIDTNTTGDQPDVRSRALLDALESLKKENMRSDSPVAGKIDTNRLGLMGWSMGGGGTWISANGHPELKVAVSLCGWIIGGPGSMTKVPSMQLAVRDDQLAAGMSQPIYAAIPEDTHKMLIEFASGGHWTANDPKNQMQQVGAYGLSWIKLHLEGDDRYEPLLKIMPKGTSDFKTNLK